MAKAEPNLLRYRLLHTAALIIHRDRRTFIKIAAGWPWADQLAAAFSRIACIRQPLLASSQTSQPPASKDLGEPDSRLASQPAVTLKINKTWMSPARP